MWRLLLVYELLWFGLCMENCDQDYDNSNVITSPEDLPSPVSSLTADVNDKRLQYYLWMKRAADGARSGGMGRSKQLRWLSNIFFCIGCNKTFFLLAITIAILTQSVVSRRELMNLQKSQIFILEGGNWGADFFNIKKGIFYQMPFHKMMPCCCIFQIVDTENGQSWRRNFVFWFRIKYYTISLNQINRSAYHASLNSSDHDAGDFFFNGEGNCNDHCLVYCCTLNLT